MEPSDLSWSRPSPRRELQGPRPTPLKVSKDSHRIKKQPAAAPPQPAAPPPQMRRPVIIYTVSPKVIHANRSEFMSLVQRLTGASAGSSSSKAPAASVSPSRMNSTGGSMSPATRLTLLEKASQPPASDGGEFSNQDMLDQLGIDGSLTSRRTGLFPGVLSPVPSSLPSVSSDLFSSSSAVQNQLNFFNELSPSFHGNRIVENTFLPSPNNFLSTPILPSPGACWDLFNQNHDF